jgi:HK97 family phage major capsid protein
MTIDAAALNNSELADVNGHITADFPVYVRSSVLAKNVDDLGLGWTFNSMLEGYLMNLKTTTGQYIYREEMNGGKLLGFPYKVSNQIPTDSQNRTEIFFGNWADLLVGEQLGLETYTTLDGSWTDENGVQHNAFEENLTATRALMYIDIAARHAESFAYIKNAKIA